MNERITYNPEMKRIHEYRKRLVEAINYKGNADHEDVPSILCEFQEEIIKEHTDKVVEQLKQLSIGTVLCDKCEYREKCDDIQEKYNPDDDTDLCTMVAKSLAIEIVKGGTA